jgi:hypothetical protein
MNLGLPYKGSKNTIAEDIVKRIPRGGRILDACCGGGAFLMAASVYSTGKKESLEKLYFNGTLDEYKRLMGAEYADTTTKQMELFTKEGA